MGGRTQGKEYFRNLAQQRVSFLWSGPENDRDIIMAFSKHLAADRKEWLRSYTVWWLMCGRASVIGALDLSCREARTSYRESLSAACSVLQDELHVDVTKGITYSDFINKELIQFSYADNIRVRSSIDIACAIRRQTCSYPGSCHVRCCVYVCNRI